MLTLLGPKHHSTVVSTQKNLLSFFHSDQGENTRTDNHSASTNRLALLYFSLVYNKNTPYSAVCSGCAKTPCFTVKPCPSHHWFEPQSPSSTLYPEYLQLPLCPRSSHRKHKLVFLIRFNEFWQSEARKEIFNFTLTQPTTKEIPQKRAILYLSIQT